MKNIEQLRREVRAAWLKACEADGIPTDTKFAVFSNTPEAALCIELMGMFLRERQRIAKSAARRARHAAMTSLGLKRVKGALGGVYYE